MIAIRCFQCFFLRSIPQKKHLFSGVHTCRVISLSRFVTAPNGIRCTWSLSFRGLTSKSSFQVCVCRPWLCPLGWRFYLSPRSTLLPEYRLPVYGCSICGWVSFVQSYPFIFTHPVRQLFARTGVIVFTYPRQLHSPCDMFLPCCVGVNRCPLLWLFLSFIPYLLRA